MNRVIRALHLISSFKRGGRERQLSILLSNSRKIDNVALYYKESRINYIPEYGLSNRTKQLSNIGFFRRVWEIVRYSQQEQIDVIVAWGVVETLLGGMAACILGIPMVNMSIRHGIRKRTAEQYFRSLLLHLSRHKIANSRAGLKANGLNRGYVLYNGIENIPIDIAGNLGSATAEMKEDKQRVILVSVANLVPYKDYFTILRALSAMKLMGYTFLYYIIGDGPLRARIMEQAQEFGLQDDIVLTGSISDVDSYLQKSDIMIHSSMGEGCSNAILEAMKWGLPVVATNVGGTPEIVNEKCGILCEYQDEKALTEALIRLIQNPDLRHKMGLEAHKVVKERFSVEAMIENYENIMFEILNTKVKQKPESRI